MTASGAASSVDGKADEGNAKVAGIKSRMCFTFNHDGNEKLFSSRAGLQLTLFKNTSQMRGSGQGSDSFRVVIHEPHTTPHVLRDGVLFDTGKETRIKVLRSYMTRENSTGAPCNETIGYSKDECFWQCLEQECIAKHNMCELFLPSSFNESKANTSLTGMDADFCYMAALNANGVDALKLSLYRVNDVSQ